jgi:hypothetical protein
MPDVILVFKIVVTFIFVIVEGFSDIIDELCSIEMFA